MAQRNQVALKDAPGLQTQPSKLVLPPGAVVGAQEADILREAVYQLRRGFNFYGPALAQVASQVLQYRLRKILHVGTTLSYDSDGIGTAWTPIPGSHSAPDASSRIHYVEAAENLYFTTSASPMVLDGLDGTPRRAGMPKGLDMNPALTGTGGGWMSPNSKVGYKLVFLRKDRNGNEIPGPASYRDEISNRAPASVAFTFAAPTVTVTHAAHGYTTGDIIEISSVSDAAYEAGPHVITVTGGGTYTYTVAGAPVTPGTGKAAKKFNVALSLTLHSEVAAGDEWQLYRTEMSSSEDTDPGDRHLFAKQGTVTAGDVAAGTIAYTDLLDQALLGIQLESNPTWNGPSQTPDRPPWARYLALWQDFVWYAHTRQAHSLKVQLLDVAGLTDEVSSVTVTATPDQRTYVFSASENVGLRKFKRWTSETTLAANIRKTMRSFVKVFNRDPGNLLEAHYVSGPTDSPGIVLLRRKGLNLPAFSLTADSAGTGGKFTPALPISGTTVASDDDYRRNGLYNARAGRPEAVPMANGWRAGSDLDDVRGILATSTALLVFTAGGAYAITGKSDGGAGKGFSIDELDLALVLEAPETLSKLDDHAYGVFNQGVCRVGAGGSAIVSEGKIGDLIRQISKFNNFSTISHGVGYESDQKYLLFTQAGNGDTTARLMWVYGYTRNTWAGPWLRPSSAALVLKGKDLLYMARSDIPRVVEERKSYSRGGQDFRDETWPCTVTAFDTVTAPEPDSGTVSRVMVTYSGFDPLGLGWQFRQGFFSGEVIALENLGGGSFRLTLDVQTTVAAGAAEVSRPIDLLLQYALDAGNAAVLKQSSEAQVYFDSPHPTRFYLGFQSDMQRSPTWSPVILNPRAGGGWGFDWGGDWGSENLGHSHPVRTKIPLDHQRNRVLTVLLRHRSAGQPCSVLQVTQDVRVISSVTKR